MRLIGLTGGIGSGKSAAADNFREAGITVIDADSIGHNLLEKDPAIQEVVLAIFGEEMLADNGIISREKLAARAFADAESRQQLNALLHPAIIAEMGRQCAALQASGQATILVEAALIGESGQKDPWLDAVILVLASEALRIERLMQYRNFSREEAKRRMAAQTPPEKKSAFADWVIDNNGDQTALRACVFQIAQEIREKQ